MAQPARVGKLSRRRWLWASFSVPVSRFLGAEPLSVTWDGDNLHIFAPKLHFLTGKPLERLKDGASVTFLSQLTIFTDHNLIAFRRAPERFVVSYDLWEEMFSVSRLGRAPRSVSHLSAVGAEGWCVESLAISSAGLAPDRQFWLRFELRAVDPQEEAGVVGEPGINLMRLIELFSLRPSAQQPRWTLEAGPLRLADFKKAAGREPRNG